jgi:CheY-like chemotaxis protein
MRFEAEVAFLDRGRYMESRFRLPKRVRFADRRISLRTRIGARERASVAVFESLFEGVASSGRLLSLSMEGLCLRLDRAIQVQGGKRLTPHQDLFTPGNEVQVVRILNLPHLPTIECSGEIRHCAPMDGGAIHLGLRLTGLGSVDLQNLERFMIRRLPSLGRSFPHRRRRGAGDAAEAEDAALLAEAEVVDPEAAALEAQDLEDSSALDELLGGLLEDTPTHSLEAPDAESSDRLLRFRRRTKRLLVIMPDDLDRSSFVCTLHIGGYTCSTEARTLIQALDLTKRQQIDAIFLDEQIGPLAGTEVALRLRKMGRLGEAPIFLFHRAPEIRVLLSAKAAGVNHVLKVPVNFDGDLKDLLDRTFGLSKL